MDVDSKIMAWIREKVKKILWEVDLPRSIPGPSIHLDLGSGHQPRNPFRCSKLVALDIFESPGNSESFEYVKADITEPLPFKDGTFSSISAYDVLEHVPRWERVNGEIKFPFINLMSEVWRILQPSGYFYAVTPMYPSAAAFGDPTHINFISESTVHYFSGEKPIASTLGYGFNGGFEIIFSGWLRGAGPYDSKGSIRQNIDNSLGLKQKSLLFFKLLRRMLLRMTNRSPQHTLWVLQKVEKKVSDSGQ